MKKILLTTIGLAALSLAGITGANAQLTFTPGNLAVLQVGDGAAAPSSAATALFLKEVSFTLDYTTPANSTASIVQTIVLPSTGANRITNSGSATSEGKLTLSANGQYLALGGYDSDAGTASIGSTTAATVNRVGVAIGANGQIASRVSFGGSAFDGNNIRGAYTADGSNFYGVGTGNSGSGGVWYATSTTQTQIFAGNYRGVTEIGGNLVSTTSANTISGNPRVQINTGMPTTADTPAAFGPGLPTTGNAVAIAAFDLNSSILGLDTIYLARESTIEKFSFDNINTTWISNGSITVTAGDFTAFWDTANNRINLFSVGTSALNWFADSDTFNTAFTGSFTSLLSAPTNTNFRGVDFAPVPEPSSILLLGLGAAALLARRKFASRK